MGHRPLLMHAVERRVKLVLFCIPSILLALEKIEMVFFNQWFSVSVLG